MVIMTEESETVCTEQFWMHLYNYFKIESMKILHIAGSAGSGRNSLIKAYLFWRLQKFPGNVFIIDTDHKYSRKTFSSWGSLQQRLYHLSVSNSDSLERILGNILNHKHLLQENDCVIINSISTIIKRKLTNSMDYQDYKVILNSVIEKIIPLIIKIVKIRQCCLIITHHVSYNFEINENIPYFHDLMHNIPGMWLYLKPSEIKKYKRQSKNKIILSYTWIENKTQKHYSNYFNYSLCNSKIKLYRFTDKKQGL